MCVFFTITYLANDSNEICRSKSVFRALSKRFLFIFLYSHKFWFFHASNGWNFICLGVPWDLLKFIQHYSINIHELVGWIRIVSFLSVFDIPWDDAGPSNTWKGTKQRATQLIVTIKYVSSVQVLYKSGRWKQKKAYISSYCMFSIYWGFER